MIVLVAAGLPGIFAPVAGSGAFAGGTGAFESWKSFTLIVSESYVNPADVKRRNPPLSVTNEVATLLDPSAAIIEMVALIAAFVNP